MEKNNENLNEHLEEENIESTEEVDTDSVENETNEETSDEDVEDVDTESTETNEVDELKAKLDEEENKYLKLYAEFENFKRRTREETERNNKYKIQSFVEDLLPVIDNLERALQETGDSESFESLHKGVEMVYNDFLNKLEAHGIKKINSTNEMFDPNFHQAVMTEGKEGVEPGIVIEEFQTGYLLKDRILRPSMVKVSE